MNRKTKIIVSITGIILVGLMLLGLTYGYFITKINGNTNAKSISVSSAKKVVEYTDLSEEITGKIIEPGYETIKVFTAKNIGDTSATYHIYLDNVVNEFIRTQDITYTLYRKSGNNTIDTSNLSDSDIVANGYLPKTNNYILLNEVIDTPNNYYTYALKINYINSDENQDEDQGHTFSFKVQLHGDIVNGFANGTLAYNILNNSMNKTNGTEFTLTPKTKPAVATSSFIYEKGTDPTTFSETLSDATNYYISYTDDYTVNESTGKLTLVNPTVATTKYTTDMASSLVGKYAVFTYDQPTVSDAQNQSEIYKISTNVSDITSTIKYAIIDRRITQTSTEKELSITTDDYGTSYYYRGGVEDNYVNFAGMCWRIVRIAGDGSTKLILEDQNTTCNNASFTGNWNLGDKNFGYTEYAKGTLTASDGTKNSSTRFIMNYLNGGTNNEESMAYAFKSFQTSKLSSYLDKLKAGDWCLDDKAYASESDNTTPLTGTEILDKQVTGTSFYYDSYVRITKEPTLKCNGTNMMKFSDNTDMYVGTLTAFEMSFAGSAIPIDYTTILINYTHYLMNNYVKNNSLRWLLLSPYLWNGSSDYVFRVSEDGVLYAVNPNISGSVRPTVSLKSSAQITGGNGTISNPYTVG